MSLTITNPVNQKKRKISILGGGPAGLAVAHYAKKSSLSFDLYEASEETGGNCRTITNGDFRFDTGAHRLHGKDPNVVNEIKELLGDELREIHKPSYIYHKGRFVHFPLTPFSLLANLRINEVIRGVYHFLKSKLNSKEVNNFRDYAYQKYGKTVADLFLTNYTEKLWGLPTERLSTSISGSRLKDLNLRSLILETIFPKMKAKHLEGAFYYPKYGFGQIAQTLSAYIGQENIHLKNRVTRIYHKNQRITGIEVNHNKILETDLTVSSLPLPILVNALDPGPPQEIIELINLFRFRSLTLFVFFLNKEQINSAATIYFPDSKYPFTRGYEPKNRSDMMTPVGKSSFVVEVPHQPKELNVKIEQITSILIDEGFFRQDEIIETATHHIPYAYPVLEVGVSNQIDKIMEYLDQFENLKITGRSGLFEYSWTHQMMSYGKEIVNNFQQ